MSRGKRVLLVFVSIVMVASMILSLRSITKTKPVMADFTTLPTIIIDAGHGGIDGGAVSQSGLLEKDINLAICLTMRDIFKANGFEVVMTRDTDTSIHDDGISTVRKQKTSDLNNRLALVNSYPNAIFLSVHQNKFTANSSTGAQIFYSPNNPQSQILAETLQKDFSSMLQPENHRKYKKAGKNLFLMYHAKCPSALVECGFLSNPSEAEMLTKPEYQAQIAFTVFSSVMRYLGLDNVS